MSNIVKYRNEFNLVGMRGWNSVEMDFLFAVMSKIKEQGTKELHFNLDELRRLAKFDINQERERWLKTIRGAINKVSSLMYWEENEEHMKAMPLFVLFDVDLKRNTLDVAVSPYFEYILNNLNANFTRFELVEFLEIRSTYAKTMYRLLKQWRTVGKHEWTIEHFRAILGIPDSYKPSHIQTRVLNPILKELPQFFPGLTVQSVKASAKGNPVVGYEFTWTPEKIVKVDTRKAKRIKKGVPMPAWAREDFVPKEYEGYEKIDKKVLEEKLRALDEKM